MTYYIGTLPETDYLEHFGIPGMKWGVRRYQEENGTLTEAGKARYGKASQRELRTLENLKKIRSDTKRMSRMTDRQRARFENDLDFYEKRTRGEVKKKNIFAQARDYHRSQSFRDRAMQQGASALGMAVMQNSFAHMLTDTELSIKDILSVLMSGILSAGETIAIDELFAKAAGRY